MKKILIVDGNAIGFAAASTSKLKSGDVETQAIYGFLRAIRMTIAAFPGYKPVVLWDGVSWRKSLFSEYKKKRDEVSRPSDVKRVEVRNSYKSQRPHIVRALKMLGVRQMVALNLEADDLAGIMVRKYPEARICLMTGDTDWLQLVREGVTWFSPIQDERVTLATFEEKTGVKTGRQWLEVKALMGDTSDEIPGVGGIGKKGAVQLVNAFGSVTSFLNRHLEGSIGVKLPKKFDDFGAGVGDSHEIWRRNIELMDLAHPSIPKPENLRITRGEIDQDAFQEFCDEFLFASITKNIEGWLDPFRSAA